MSVHRHRDRGRRRRSDVIGRVSRREDSPPQARRAAREEGDYILHPQQGPVLVLGEL